MQMAKIPTYPVVCRFPLSVALRDHNRPPLQTNGQMSCWLHNALINIT